MSECSPEVNVGFLVVTLELVEVDRQETEAWFLCMTMV